MKFGIGLGVEEPREALQILNLADSLDYSTAFFADSQALWRETFTSLAYYAAKTNKIVLGTGVTNPITRHVTVLASAAATLYELSNSRFVLGIGTGESSVSAIGKKRSSIQRLTETIQIIKSLTLGKKTSVDGVDVQFEWAKANVPIYMSAHGPNALKLAGSVADGVIFSLGTRLEAAKFALSKIEEGAKRSGRALKEIEVIMRFACVIGDNYSEMLNEARPYSALAAYNWAKSIPLEILPPHLQVQAKAVRDAYDFRRHIRDNAKHLNLVTDEIIKSTTLVGNSKDVIAQLKLFSQLGINSFNLAIFNIKDKPKFLQTFSENVMKPLGD